MFDAAVKTNNSARQILPIFLIRTLLICTSGGLGARASPHQHQRHNAEDHAQAMQQRVQKLLARMIIRADCQPFGTHSLLPIISMPTHHLRHVHVTHSCYARIRQNSCRDRIMDGEKKEDKPHSDGDDFASEQLDAQHFCAEPQSDVVSAGVLAAQRSLDAISVGISCIKGSAKATRCSCAA